MKFKIPFTFSGVDVLLKRSEGFFKFVKAKKRKLDVYLDNIGLDFNSQAYIAICLRNFVLNFLVLSVVFTFFLGFLGANMFFVLGPGISLLVSVFVFFIQMAYPRNFVNSKSKDIERNLLPALEDMQVQLNSGIPLFQIMLNLAHAGYGQFSEELKKITSEISSGTPQMKALENAAKLNVSPYFKRVLWQISNAMRAGSNLSIIIGEEINNLAEEQTIQIQNYGNKLNPIVMFYMLIAVILPSLGISFFIIIASLLKFSEGLIKVSFFTIFGVVVLIQFMFLGLIKTRRPNLL